MIVKGLIIGGKEVKKEPYLDIFYPYTEEIIGKVSIGTKDDVEKAVEEAKIGFNILKNLSSYKRYEILKTVSQKLLEQKEEIAKTIVLEVGKTIREARLEVERASQTFLFAAEEAKRINGETYPLDAHPSGEGKFGFYIREPAGIVGAITPFNFPLNLSAHKVAPAIGAGCAIILKPSEKTPFSPIKMVELLIEAGLPKEAISLIPGFKDVGEAIVTHKDIRVISFTGSKAVGEAISKSAGIKKLVLELGSNSALVVHKDADIKKAVKKAVMGGFSMAGQVCISVQRVVVHQDILESFLQELKIEIENLKIGDPMDDSTDIGPMISSKEVERVKNWVEEAIKKGASLIKKANVATKKTILEPTVVINPSFDTKVFKEEAFAPIINVIPYKDVDEAINIVNNSEYGLQVGVFTRDLKVAFEFIKKASVGGVNINEGPSFRADHIPYGGVKNSGIGREGPKFAIEDYTEIKNVVIDLSF